MKPSLVDVLPASHRFRRSAGKAARLALLGAGLGLAFPAFAAPLGLLLHYRFGDGGTGVLADSGPYGFQGEAASGADFEEGGRGPALRLPENAAVRTPSSDRFNLGAEDSKTFALWWKAETLSPQNLCLFTRRRVENRNKGLAFIVEYGSVYYLHVQIDHWVKFRPPALKPGEWSHVAVTKEGARWRVFHNGVELAPVSAMGWPAAADVQVSEPVTLGRDPTFPMSFRGWMDDFRIYGSALTPEEIAELYGKGSDLREPALPDPEPPAVPAGVSEEGPSAPSAPLEPSDDSPSTGLSGPSGSADPSEPADLADPSESAGPTDQSEPEDLTDPSDESEGTESSEE